MTLRAGLDEAAAGVDWVSLVGQWECLFTVGWRVADLE